MDANEALSLAEKLAEKLKRRVVDVAKRDAYYAGEQSLKFATKQWAEAHAKRYEGFSDNWCGVVADSPAERVHVTGFRLDTSAEMSADERELWRDWTVNDLDSQSSQGFLEAFIAARSFALVWGSPDGEPEVTWEHPGQVYVAYTGRTRAAAIKSWSDDDFDYLTLYLPDEVWKWAKDRTRQSGIVLPDNVRLEDGQWLPRDVPGESWPLENPMGVVPIVEFENRPRLGKEPMSDIAGTMAMQDAINLLWAYLFNAADFASMPGRVIMGQAPPMIPLLDEAGQKVGEVPVDEKKLAEGRLLWLTGQNTKIGSFPAADLTSFTTVVEVAVGHLAAQTRTPQHYLVGKMANLSGDALKAAETGLVKKCEEAQINFTAPTRELFRLMALARGKTGVAEAAATGIVQWKDAESRSEAQLVDAIQKLKDVGFPFEWLAERYGLNDTEITRVMEMRAAEQTDPLLADIASKLTGPVPGGSAAPAVGA